LARKYVARDPRTGRRIGGRRRSKSPVEGIAALSPSPGPWQSIPVPDILPIACGEVAKIEILSDRGTWTLGRIDAIKALHKVLEKDAGEAYLALVEALEDDYPDVRIAGLKSLPSFALRRQGILLQCLSDRLLDEEEAVREGARDCLRKVAPLFPSGCEGILRRELRDARKEHRDSAFDALKKAAKQWPEVGCLHLDELIREDEEDLRIRGSMILRTIASKGGAEAWDLISWSLQDEEVRVRRNAARTLAVLADSEPRIAAIMVESSIGEDDRRIREAIIRALKKLDMQSPKVAQMIVKGAGDKNLEMRRACIGQLAIIMTGQELREAAGELLRKEKDPELKKRLRALSTDPDFEGTEEDKNKKLAPVDYVPPEGHDSAPEQTPPVREADKRDSGRSASEESR
jgi:hypothetical protein|tara:strand:- start:1853 stop:3061 length:1209 start_codon:yes stop_codon:yes gene_type:complete